MFLCLPGVFISFSNSSKFVNKNKFVVRLSCWTRLVSEDIWISPNTEDTTHNASAKQHRMLMLPFKAKFWEGE